MSIDPAVGRQAKYIRCQSDTWNTEATGTWAVWDIWEDGVGVTQALDPIEESDGIFLKDSDVGEHSAAFAPREALRFDVIAPLMMSIGTSNYSEPTAANAGKGDYEHINRPAEDITGLFDSIGIKKGSYIHSLYSVKYRGWTLEGTTSPQRVTVSHDCIASRLDNASTVVTANVFTAADAEPSGNGGRAYFRNMTVKIKNQSAATAIATGDAVSNLISSFSFTWGRNLAEERDNSSGIYVAEPDEDGYPEATLSLTFRGMESATDTALTNLLGNTTKMLELEIVGNAASAATGTVNNAGLKIEAPRVKVLEVEAGPFSGPGKLPASVVYGLYAPDTTSDAEDMAFAEPFQITVTNNQAAAVIS